MESQQSLQDHGDRDGDRDDEGEDDEDGEDGDGEDGDGDHDVCHVQYQPSLQRVPLGDASH